MNSMPKHLRIIVGLMILGVLTRVIFLGLFFSRTGQSPRLLMDLTAIVITIGLIKGFVSRSTVAWHLAKVLNVLGLLAVSVMVIMLSVARNIPPWLWLCVLAGSTAEIYTLLVLFSRDVRRYFTGEGMAQQ